MNTKTLSNFQDPALDPYARLTENQLKHYYEPNGGLFIAESLYVITRALDAGYEPVSFLMEPRHAQGEIRSILDRYPEVPVYLAELSVLKQLTGFPMTRGILCTLKRPPLCSAEELLPKARRIAILENVMNPTNLGAIFRSAAALGVDAVLLSAGCTDPLYRRASRVSMGTVFQIPWTFLEGKNAAWPHPAIEFLKNQGFIIAASALTDQSVSIRDPRLKQAEKLAIVLGTEGDGLCAETLRAADIVIKIPMTPGVDSLNVAAASAVMFWETKHSV